MSSLGTIWFQLQHSKIPKGLELGQHVTERVWINLIPWPSHQTKTWESGFLIWLTIIMQLSMNQTLGMPCNTMQKETKVSLIVFVCIKQSIWNHISQGKNAGLE